MLCGNRVMHVPTAPLADSPHGATETILRRPLLHHPLAITRQAPVVREAEQVEGSRTAIAPVVARWFEAHQPRLVRMQRQSVLSESLRQHVEHALGVFLPLEDED